jgi:hypothetical protein
MPFGRRPWPPGGGAATAAAAAGQQLARVCCDARAAQAAVVAACSTWEQTEAADALQELGEVSMLLAADVAAWAPRGRRVGAALQMPRGRRLVGAGSARGRRGVTAQ